MQNFLLIAINVNSQIEPVAQRLYCPQACFCGNPDSTINTHNNYLVNYLRHFSIFRKCFFQPPPPTVGGGLSFCRLVVAFDILNHSLQFLSKPQDLYPLQPELFAIASLEYFLLAERFESFNRRQNHLANCILHFINS